VKENLINVTTRVNEKTHKWLENKAKKEKRSIASLIAIAIENLINLEK